MLNPPLQSTQRLGHDFGATEEDPKCIHAPEQRIRVRDRTGDSRG